MQDHIQQESCRKKKLDVGYSVLLHPPYLQDFAQSNFHLFSSLQNALNGKNFSHEDQVKIFVENFFSSKPVKFYLRGLHKLLGKWQELIQNNSEYTIDWNHFVNKYIINILQKRKIFVTQPNIYVKHYESYWFVDRRQILLKIKLLWNSRGVSVHAFEFS